MPFKGGRGVESVEAVLASPGSAHGVHLIITQTAVSSGRRGVSAARSAAKGRELLCIVGVRCRAVVVLLIGQTAILSTASLILLLPRSSSNLETALATASATISASTTTAMMVLTVLDSGRGRQLLKVDVKLVVSRWLVLHINVVQLSSKNKQKTSRLETITSTRQCFHLHMCPPPRAGAPSPPPPPPAGR